MFQRRWLVCLAVACSALFLGTTENPASAIGPGWWGFGRPCFVHRGGPVRNILGRIHDRWHGRHWGYGWGYGYGGWGCAYAPVWDYGLYGCGPSWCDYGGWTVCQSRAVYSNMNLYVDSAAGAVQRQPYWITPNSVDSRVGSTSSDAKPALANSLPKVRGDTVVLELSVPADAVVTINGHRTQSRGASRQFIARQLSPVREYTFEIQAVIQRDGRELVHSTLVTSRTGQHQNVSMAEVAFRYAPQPTTLVVHVPADARLILAGAPAKQVGETRVFTTTALGEGQKWDGYHVVAEVERDGQILREEATLALIGGADHELTFQFAPPQSQVAAR